MKVDLMEKLVTHKESLYASMAEKYLTEKGDEKTLKTIIMNRKKSLKNRKQCIKW